MQGSFSEKARFDLARAAIAGKVWIQIFDDNSCSPGTPTDATDRKIGPKLVGVTVFL